jgi:hypothetical protein
MTQGPRAMLAEMRLNNEVLKLRRQALEIARNVIAEEHPEYDAEQLELAACDLCDAQVKEVTKEKEGQSK